MGVEVGGSVPPAGAQCALIPGDRCAVQWRALGPVEAVVGGRLVDLGPPRQRALFGLLLSRVGRPVAVDALVEQLWAGFTDPARPGRPVWRVLTGLDGVSKSSRSCSNASFSALS